MVYAKIHDDRYLDSRDAEDYLESDINEGLCFFGNRDFGFIGNDKMKSIYKAINEYVDDDTDIEDLEYYFDVDTAKAEEIHNILDKCYRQRIIREQELFQAIAEVVMGKPFYQVKLRGASQSDWTNCLYPSEFYSDEYEGYLEAIFFGTGIWVEISEDPYFDDTYWDYVAIPYANEDEVKKYLEDNYDKNVMIVDDDWDYDEYNSPHDADNLHDDTNYDFESLQLKGINESFKDDIGVISNLYKILDSVESERDLRKLGLTMTDYYTALDVFNYVNKPGRSTQCLSKSVADFYRKYGFDVTDPSGDEVNYIIEAPSSSLGNNPYARKSMKDAMQELRVTESLDTHGVDVDSIKAFTPTIREWYLSEYPDDDLGEEIEDETFAMLYHTLRGGYDVYDVIGVGDSVIRERLFSKLAELGKVDYDIIYDMWLDEYAPSRKANLTLRDF